MYISFYLTDTFGRSSSNVTTAYNQTGQLPSSSNSGRDMLDEIEETFNISNPSSINTSFRPTSQLNDFFSSTLDEFRNLTLNNIAEDDSSDDNVEDYDTTQFQESNRQHSSSRN